MEKFSRCARRPDWPLLLPAPLHLSRRRISHCDPGLTPWRGSVQCRGMSADREHKRQLNLLERLAKISDFRTDRKIPLSEIHAELDVGHFKGGTRIVFKDKSQWEES